MRICLNDGWKFFIDYENENFVSVRLPHTELLNSLSSINIKHNRFIYRNEFSYLDDFKNFVVKRIKGLWWPYVKYGFLFLLFHLQYFDLFHLLFLVF